MFHLRDSASPIDGLSDYQWTIHIRGVNQPDTARHHARSWSWDVLAFNEAAYLLFEDFRAPRPNMLRINDWWVDPEIVRIGDTEIELRDPQVGWLTRHLSILVSEDKPGLRVVLYDATR
ncbi:MULTISPECIES: hypothetical protein [unclassified Rhizobium]|uniref:hypothetical protein n=1 Tax=unclassified Rhizobium TaxID=2613769 RepID=UPI000EAA3940|nr:MULTISPECIES: hypothetical protein [unclassified Rhizobium]AYG69863.1 hypothetical protein CCGE531_27645 [Rhizobium sp. CCGE531]AYG76243.1 hypothetical protein CCGE532_27135 [Rhizobium sp. CCGE532]